MKKNFSIIVLIISFIMITGGIFLITNNKNEQIQTITPQKQALKKLNEEYPLSNYGYVLKEETSDEYRYIVKELNDNKIYSVNKKTFQIFVSTIIE